MLGSPDEAEDLVQETYLRAWRSYGDFEGRSSLRTWLYRIATNACLTALEQRGRRALPSGLGGPVDDPDAAVTPACDGISRLEPVPDARVIPDSADPAEVVAAGEGVRLALIASLQYLAPRQRAVLLLREVRRFPAAEVGRDARRVHRGGQERAAARPCRLGQAAPSPGRLVEPADPRAREQLALYIAGFEHADLAALEKALRADAAIEVAGALTWFSGKTTCLRYLAGVIGLPGSYLIDADRRQRAASGGRLPARRRRAIPRLRPRRAHRDRRWHRQDQRLRRRRAAGGARSACRPSGRGSRTWVCCRACQRSPARSSIVSGYFNPLHVGHLDMMEAARSLTGYLVVIVNNDAQQMLKKGKIIQSLDDRLRIVRALRVADDGIGAVDQDATVREKVQPAAGPRTGTPTRR